MQNIIETPRLRLRPWKETDRPPFFELNSDPEVMRYFPKTLSRQESDEMIDKCQARLERDGYGWFAAELKQTGEFIGTIAVQQVPAFVPQLSDRLEIGWRLRKKFWGHGYASEGARLLLAWCFENLELEEVIAMTSIPNIPSMRVMERIGMVRNSKDDFEHQKCLETPHIKDHVVYRIFNLKPLNDLPSNFEELRKICEREKRDFLSRMKVEWKDGSNRFDKVGEGLWGIMKGRECVAIAGLNCDPYLKDPEVARFRHLFVHPDYRTKGMGQFLTKHALEHAKNCFSTVRLRTLNPEAAKLYGALGFTPTSEENVLSLSVSCSKNS